MQDSVFVPPQLGAEVIINALNELVRDMLSFLPRLIIALLIWYIGRYLVKFAVGLVRKFDLPKTKAEDEAVNTIARGIEIFGRIVLVLIILDYLGIGRTVVGAIANGLTFAVAIALGLSFGKALEPDAKAVVDVVRKIVKK